MTARHSGKKNVMAAKKQEFFRLCRKFPQTRPLTIGRSLGIGKTTIDRWTKEFREDPDAF